MSPFDKLRKSDVPSTPKLKKTPPLNVIRRQSEQHRESLEGIIKQDKGRFDYDNPENIERWRRGVPLQASLATPSTSKSPDLRASQQPLKRRFTESTPQPPSSRTTRPDPSAPESWTTYSTHQPPSSRTTRPDPSAPKRWITYSNSRQRVLPLSEADLRKLQEADEAGIRKATEFVEREERKYRNP